MMKRSFLFSLLSLLFVFCNQISLRPIHAAPVLKYQNKNDNYNETRHLRKRQLNDGEIVCVDLADFFYEIVLSVTSFPEQGTCSEQEEADIAALLEQSVNDELRAIPGTINTENKVCSDPINSRRHLLGGATTGPLFNYHAKEQEYGETTNFKDQDERSLTQHNDHSYVYVGGGRCRYCFYDDLDQRRLSPVAMNELQTRNQVLKSQNKYGRRRNLLFMSALKLERQPLPKVADILHCEEFTHKTFFLEDERAHSSYRDLITWKNQKETKLPVLLYGRSEFVYWDIIGPYVPGESFGVQLDMSSAAQEKEQDYVEYIKDRYGDDAEMVQLPVKEGEIIFRLYAFDMPTDAPLTAHPLIVFVNGIILDFKLLMSEPGVLTVQTYNSEVMSGSSFAGIQWEITRWKYSTHHAKNFAHGPLPDITYDVSITAPLIVFEHKNQLDIGFLIHPNAKANQYAISLLRVSLAAARCEVLGIENSPFEEFKSVVESRLFQRLGLDLADEFQGKEGHCLYNKIPVVSVNLVEKQDWEESNPQCGN